MPWEKIGNIRGPQGHPGADGASGQDGRDAYHGEARGTYDPEAEYRALDVVAFNGCEWRARRDAPGPLPGDGWMLSASRGKRGDRGDPGKEGPVGPPGTGFVAFYPDEKTGELVLTREDGSELRAFPPGLRA